jgi:type I restriction enzyme S subunit
MMQQLLTGRIRLLAPRASAAPAGPKPKGRQGHNWAFNEAVVIAVLAGHFGDEQHPLGRMRYTKLSYLLHRCTDGQVGDYLKKAAGPYNPKTRYGGPERIAVSNGYVREHRSGRFRGFVAAENNAQAEDYFQKWYGSDAIRWLEQFRWRRNEELEVLATVDVAAQELRAAGEEIDVRGVKAVLRRHGEWQAKLSRPAFSDASVARAIETARRLFGADGEAGGG